MPASIKQETLKLKHSISRFRIKGKLYMVGFKAMHQQPTAFKLSELSA
jgi:hypothetical protein